MKNGIKEIFLPQSELQYESSLSCEEVINIIKNNILWNENLSRYGARNKYTFYDFEGYSKNSFFNLRRILKFGVNSFIPIVFGNVIQREKGSTINIKISLQIKVRSGLTIFNVFTIFFIIINSFVKIDIIFIGSIVFLLFNITMTHVIFNNESKNVCNFLEKLIKNKPAGADMLSGSDATGQ